MKLYYSNKKKIADHDGDDFIFHRVKNVVVVILLEINLYHFELIVAI